MFKGFQKLIVLEELRSGSKSGYDIIKKIEELTGKWSPGYVYPLLKEFKEKGFITEKQEGRKKIYKLNIKGKKFLKRIEESRRTMLTSLASIIQAGNLLEDEGFKDLIAKCEKYTQHIILDLDLYKEFQKARCKVYENQFKQKRARFREILKKTVSELKKL
jgi:DNA-binding PadR family transcriptional regulator